MPRILSLMKQAWLRFKCLDRGHDLDDHVSNAFNHVSPTREASIAKSYINGEVGLHLHIIGRVGDLNHGEYCIVTEHRRIEECRRRNDFRVRRWNVNAETAGSCRNDRDQLVLVGVIKDSDDVQKRKVWSSGVERLRPLDECSGLSFHSSDSPDALALPTLSRCEDRELRVRISPVASSKAPSDVIEGRSKVVNAVADQQAPSFCGDFWGALEPNDTQVVCWLIDNKSISFRLNKGVEFSLDRIEMMLRPTEFGTTVTKQHVAEAVNS